MAKKKQHPVRNVVKPKSDPPAAKSEPMDTIVAPPVAEAVEAGSLVDEVQSLLSRRNSLAAKLAEEIATTEKKLAELKKTAALLTPDTKAPAPAKEKSKPKKVKKSAPRGETAAEANATPETPAE